MGAVKRKRPVRLPTYHDLPVVPRQHYAAPRLPEGQAREALHVGIALQASASGLVRRQDRQAQQSRQRKVVHEAAVVLLLELLALLAVTGAAVGWWPVPPGLEQPVLFWP